LDAELIRDFALSVSGLLDNKIGGASVKPYQPDGYWENLNFPVRQYVADGGPAQYRRGLYTWWQRSFLHPSMLAFDAPSREECVAERNRSNIPQQALVLANSPLVRNMSQALADQLWEQAHQPASSVGDSALRMPGSRPVDAEGDHTLGNDASSRFIAAAFQRVLGRGPTQAERVACRRFLDDPAPFTPSDATGSARASLVHVLINHNDFVTVR
jgi:hypothetical protein